MLAGIAQSKMLIEQRHSFKMNDRVILLHQKRVAAKRMMIDEVKFMISNTPANDPERVVQMHDLKELNNPAETRTVLSLGIQAANNAPITKTFKMGVFAQKAL